MRILVNTLNYIDASGGLPTVKKLGPDVPVEREHATEPRFRVGRPIKLRRELRESIREHTRNGKSWTLMSRFMVRGHWKNQHFGPGRELVRKIWIQPYWKGPEGIVDALERQYEVLKPS